MSKYNQTLDEQALLERIGKNLKHYRKLRKIPQEVFAPQLGLIQSALSRIETGTQGITAPQFLKACDLLSVSIDQMTRERPPEPPAFSLLEMTEEVLGGKVTDPKYRRELKSWAHVEPEFGETEGHWIVARIADQPLGLKELAELRDWAAGILDWAKKRQG